MRRSLPVPILAGGVRSLLKICWRRDAGRGSDEGRRAGSVVALRSRSRDEEGFALLDVAVAILVLMVVLLPVAYLLSTTSKIQGSNQNRLTAQSLAASWLQQELTAAQQSQSSAPSVSTPGGSTANPTWPSASGTEIVGTITYDIYLTGGWCAYSGSGSAWTNGTVTTTTNTGKSTPLSFFIAVKVAWGPDASQPNPVSVGQNDGMVVEYSAMPSQTEWTVQQGGNPVSVLTLTNTGSISGNICPLTLNGVA